MLIRKGSRVVVDLKNGKSVLCPPSWSMLHDPDGKDWPQKQVLVARVVIKGEPVDYGPARSYFGSGWESIRGQTAIPARNLSAWTKVGAIEKIWYTRPGTSHPGPFKHKVGGGWLSAIFGERRAILYRRPGAFLMNFPDGLTADARGFVHP